MNLEPKESPNLEDKAEMNAIVPIQRTIPTQLDLIAIKHRPIFPHMVVPLVVEGAGAIHSLQLALKNKAPHIGLVLAKDSFDFENYNQADLFEIGVAARIVKVFHINNDNAQILLDIISRIKLVSIEQLSNDKNEKSDSLIAKIAVIQEQSTPPTDVIRAYCREIISNLKEIIKLNPLVKEELSQFINQINIDDPNRLADFASSLSSADRFELQVILEQNEIQPRLEKTLQLIKKELDLSRLQAKISHKIEERISKNQREFFLKEQLREIQKELGLNKDDKSQELEKLKKRAQNLKFSKQAKQVFDEEISKLTLLETQSPEFNVSRNYLDWLTILPWGKYSKENLDITRAKKILEQDHFGLKDVKERILNMIATMILKKQVSGKIICLIGPPGVGKTSVGKSVARSLNRPFFRFSLGGMRDEAEIKGHRRTYIGAMPGKFIQSLKSVGVSNPVIMLDEIDKINRSFNGDPASALLEVLDREQNNSFLDHYLDLAFDLSKVLFIATANQLDTIPEPLKDRMEIIRLAGYIAEEKLEIAKRYLVKKQLAHNGLTSKHLSFSSASLRKIIDGYAREAGVRDLEKKIEQICQQVARKAVEAKDKFEKVNFGLADIKSYLKHPAYNESEIIGKNRPGCINGLAWTSLGGAILSIEASLRDAKQSSFKQTGQLGDVMVESSEIAYSYILANASRYKVEPKAYQQKAVHLHVPAGATPKDGPSAGIAMAAALLSLLLNKAPKANVAMTGELSLTGEVLPIGGLKEKLIAAKRLKIKEVILPEQNKADLELVEDNIKKKINISFVKKFEDVANICF